MRMEVVSLGALVPSSRSRSARISLEPADAVSRCQVARMNSAAAAQDGDPSSCADHRDPPAPGTTLKTATIVGLTLLFNLFHGRLLTVETRGAQQFSLVAPVRRHRALDAHGAQNKGLDTSDNHSLSGVLSARTAPKAVR